MLMQVFLGRRYHHPGAIPWIFMIISILMLISLGVWQLQRLEWKEELLSKMEAGQQLVPVVQLPPSSQMLEDLLYRRVKLTGDLQRDQYFLRIGINRDLGSGYFVLTPLALPNFVDNIYILVNRGFVAGEKQEVEDMLKAEIEQTKNPTIIHGILRPAYAPRLFSPKNHVDKNIWSSEDIQAMQTTLGINLLPYVIEVTKEEAMKGESIAKPNKAEIRLRNDHLGYAITWFGLAITGLVMFYFYCWKKE